MEIVILGLLLLGALFMLVVMFTEMMNFVQTRVPFVPTAKADLEFMIERAGIGAEDYVYDLGSGNGKVVFAMADLAGARAKGFQRSGWTQWYAKLRRAMQSQSRTEFVTGNFFDYSWSDATVVYAYLYPFLMQSVEDKALEDCQPGTKIVVRDFNLPSLPHSDTWQTPTGHTMYLYLIK
ncbi:MAG TPA: hypothetical protein VHQ41_01880 [Patescibacteria group bacterium]|jgi:ubiquinone/menaquinone biosynthesis C-methylase UbiE|nr:hypothetical protein [Patescibacteria group bacterium]